MDKSKWILIVEDELYQNKSLSIILKKQGYQVVTATTGEEARSYLDKHVYDLVLLDLHIGSNNGLDLLTMIHNCDLKMHILIVTGDISQETSLEAIQRGADDILIKPVSPPELLEKISLILSGNQPSKN
jgi:DNA-binding response OmpR family regulator